MLARTSSGERSSERLRARRRRRRRYLLIAGLLLLVALAGFAVYGLRQPGLRILKIQVYGADPSFAQYATDAMRGYYGGLIPRDSTFFYPAEKIRGTIMDAHPEIAAVSLFRNGFNGLTIKIDERTAVAEWCGLSPTPGVDEYCYVFDVNGFVFAPAASTTETLNPFKVYAPLANDPNHTLDPLRATLTHPENLPSAFDFARQVGTLGSPVESVVIRGDEVDDLLKSGTRITYVFGDEQNAFSALVSAKDQFNLSDGSVDYVDLRFDGKIYLKKKEIAK